MTPSILNEREFELINIIGAELASNQRDLSRRMALSLGMTNMLVRRLISKGYIRIQQLNKRKVQYILTPQGFTEKMRKSVKYTIKTINSIGLIKSQLKALLQKLYGEGERKFFVLGESDFVTLVEWVLREVASSGCSFDPLKDLPTGKIDGVILICREDVGDINLYGNRHIDLLKELSTDVIPGNGTEVS